MSTFFNNEICNTFFFYPFIVKLANVSSNQKKQVRSNRFGIDNEREKKTMNCKLANGNYQRGKIGGGGNITSDRQKQQNYYKKYINGI